MLGLGGIVGTLSVYKNSLSVYKNIICLLEIIQNAFFFFVRTHYGYFGICSLFFQAIPIKDPLVLSKIHQTYRIGYLKVGSHTFVISNSYPFYGIRLLTCCHVLQDVVLGRVLDDAVVANLNSVIHANNAIVSCPWKCYHICGIERMHPIFLCN